MPSEISQTEKDKNCIWFHSHVGYKWNQQTSTPKNKLIGRDNRMLVIRGEGRWGGGRQQRASDIMVTKTDWALGGEHTIKYTDIL